MAPSAPLNGGSKGCEGCMPPPQSKFFQFHAVFGKFWQNRMLVPPPQGNPGSATALGSATTGFPTRGALIPEGCANLLFGTLFAKSCMQMKNMD